MQDFIRIGGAITSAPLNEDFRRLLNAISISNTNLVFPEVNMVVNTIKEMTEINNPEDAQACYVISSGEFYRYSKKDNKWHQIMDIGQTFRQGFLNSGAVVLEDEIKLKEDSKTTLLMPSMLVYFKNKPGDARYLKGMYLIEPKELDITGKISGPDAYSISVNYIGEYSVTTGMPKQDDPNNVYIGTILVNKKNEIIPEFIFTIPDIAFTSDRGTFMMYGGEAEGMNLLPSGNATAQVNRAAGFYYDEGINYTKGQTEDYPIDTDNGSNFNLKYYNAVSPVEILYYMTPQDALNNDIVRTNGIVKDRYYKDGKLEEVPLGYFTIQQHLVTPNGQDVILYGDTIYNSLTDAVSNLNSSYGLDINFPYIHATKIVVCNQTDFSTDNSSLCKFYTIGRLAQVGTISPEFADNAFKIYSGDAQDNTPATVRFVLDELQQEQYNDLYHLTILPSNVNRKYFYGNKKYIKNDQIDDVTPSEDITRIINGQDGYRLADNEDLNDAISRIEAIEREIWEPENEAFQRYEQSLRFRIFNTEIRLDAHDTLLTNHTNRIEYLEKNKVHKNTTINAYSLGDNDDNNEAKAIVLKTGDIDEGQGQGTDTNLWYTDARVSANADVVSAINHINTVSANDNVSGHAVVNPHNLSTDDIKLLTDTDRLFITQVEERRIRADKLPDDTIQALEDLDTKKIDNIPVYTIEGNSEQPGSTNLLGKAKNIKFYKDGVNVVMGADNETVIVECVGQLDEDVLMTKARYATIEQEYPDIYEGFVDNAVNAAFADNIHGIDEAYANQYYGTNKDNVIGIYDLPKYVSTASGSDYVDVDQVTFIPINDSVQEKHLLPSLRDKINNNYHAVYESGILKSDEINQINFGDNLTVSINDHIATVNSAGAGGAGVQSFINLEDVQMVYTGNEGKVLVVNEEGTGIVAETMPSLKTFMLKSTYVSPRDVTKVKKAENADIAETANTAINANAVGSKIVDDTLATNAVLWTAAKIISNTSTQIVNEGVRTYSGTSAPSNSLGKNGDLYILLES